MSNIQSWLSKAVSVGLFVILILSPTQFSLAIKGAHVSLVDPLVLLVGALWIPAVLLENRGLRSLLKIIPSYECIVFMMLIALSALKAESLKDVVKESIQMAEYVLVALLLFARAERSAWQHRQLVNVFYGLVTCIVIWGTVDYWQLSKDVMEVKSAFGNRNVYGGFLAISLPFVISGVLYEKQRVKRMWLLLVACAGVLTVLAGGAAIALLIAGTVICAFFSTRSLWIWGATCLLIVFALSLLPRENLLTLRDSIALYDEDTEVEFRYTEWQAALQVAEEEPWLGLGLGNYQQQVGQYFGLLTFREGPKEPDHNNLFLVVLASTGILGVSGLLFMLSVWLSRVLKVFRMDTKQEQQNRKQLALAAVGTLVAFCVCSVWTALLIRGVAIPFIFIIGMALYEQGEAANPTPTKDD